MTKTLIVTPGRTGSNLLINTFKAAGYRTGSQVNSNRAEVDVLHSHIASSPWPTQHTRVIASVRLDIERAIGSCVLTDTLTRSPYRTVWQEPQTLDYGKAMHNATRWCRVQLELLKWVNQHTWNCKPQAIWLEDCTSPQTTAKLLGIDEQQPVSYTHLTLPTILRV